MLKPWCDTDKRIEAERPSNMCVLGSGALDGVRGGARSNGYSVTVSAESHSLVIEPVSYHRVVLGVLRDAQNPAYIDRIQACTPIGCVLDRMHQTVRAGARSNSYSVMVSAGGHGLVIGRVSYHRVVLGVLRKGCTNIRIPVQ